MRTNRIGNRERRNQAFTLIEMVLVLAIIALLVGAGVVHLRGVMDTGKVARVEMDLQALTAALRLYQINSAFLPSTEQGLKALVEQPSGAPQPRTWKKQLEKELVDPWGRPYQYRFPGKFRQDSFDIWSLGADGIESEDDIGNWS